MAEERTAGSEGRVRGLVLCRAGGHPIAFPAEQVVQIDAWVEGVGGAKHARAAYALPPAEGRLLRGEEGDGVVVDALEIVQDALPLLPAPDLLRRAGGWLRGFSAVRGELWPVLQLVEFSRFLATREAVAAP